MNHKGENYIATDGSEQTIWIDDVEIIAQGPQTVERNGLFYAWDGFCYCRLAGERPLKTVHPEFDLLMLGRGIWNMASGLMSSAAKGGIHSVYRGLDAAGKTRYVGITGRDPAVRLAEHAASGTAKAGLTYQPVATGLTQTGARIWEQNMINSLGLQKNGGQLFNQINSIAPKNWWQYGIYP